MIRRILSLLLVSLAVGAGGQTVDPNNARGFEAGKVYNFFGLDSVNPFTGNLNLRIPIGQSYSLRPGFSYQLMLTYNSKLWDYEVNEITSTVNVKFKVRNALPETYSNTGFGWLLSLGKVRKPSNGAGWTYIAPDGSQHDFKAGPNPLQMEDSSYLRMTLTPENPLPADVTEIKIESPDGVVSRFDSTGELVEMTDGYGNWVRVARNGLLWTITDGYDTSTTRSHTIEFEEAPAGRYASNNFKTRVKKVELAAFPALQQTRAQARAVYSFTYNDATVENGGCGSPARDVWKPDAHFNVPLLKRIDLPDGSSYELTYRTANETVPCSSGIAEKLTLPTQGAIAWSHRAYDLPRPTCAVEPDRDLWTDRYSGVEERRLHSHTGAVLSKTTYAPSLAATGTGHFACSGGKNETRELPPKVAETIVTDTGTAVKHYFSAFRASDPVLWTSDVSVAEYGLPFTRTIAEAGLALSTQTLNGDNVVRATYVAYDYENSGRNSRLRTSRTIFHDDADANDPTSCRTAQGTVTPCWTETSRSDYAGFGHYRTETASSNFPGSVTRETYRNYNPGGLTSATWPAGRRWFLGDYTTSSVSEGNVTRSSITTFDTDKGVVKWVQTGLVEAGSTAHPLVSATCRDARGYITSERWVGGDGRALPSNPCTATRRTKEFVLNHTYTFNPDTIVHTAEWDGTTLNMNIDSPDPLDMTNEVVDETLDANTGLPLTTRDGANLTTTYRFDASSRLASVAAPGLAATTYKYSNASVTGVKLTPAVVEVSTTSAVPAHGEISAQYQYDSLGRLWREKKLMPDASWSVRETLYDTEGRKASVSEMEKLVTPNVQGATEFDFVPANKTTFGNYDVFGRAGTITAPDGKVTTRTYRGARTTTRTISIAGITGLQSVSTVEETDAHGRLASVTEAAGITGQVKTSYGYDPAGNLTSVVMGEAAGTIAQQRTFAYDRRGLLVSETHPESGLTTYSLYDARGQARRKTTGTAQLTMSFDDASRLLDVVTIGGYVKRYRYDPANGRLNATARDNDSALGLISVTETIQYDDANGRPIARYQTVGSSALSISRTFAHGVSYNDLGQVISIQYPFDIHVTDWTRPTIWRGYRNGSLTSVDGWATLSYHPNGMVASVIHSSGVTDTWQADPHSMARPRAITTTAGGTQLWSTGTYGFDGAGNISSIGTTRYGYDAFGRLAGWTEEPVPGAARRRRIDYDTFGNQLSFSLQSCIAAGTCTTTGTMHREITNAVSNQYADTAYDASGNVTQDAQGRSYTYDAVNMPKSITAGGRTFHYVYTVDDERIAAIEDLGGGARKTIWTLRGLDNQLLSVWTDAAWKEDQIWRGSSLVGFRTPQGSRHYSVDHLGSPRVITSATGSLIGIQTFEPFGAGGTTGSGALQFTGHERDTANLADGTVNLPDYAHARLLDTTWGRFLSVDPGGYFPERPQSWNRYAYASNDPINRVDPDGREDNRSAQDVAMLEDFDTLAMTGEAVSRTNLGASMLSQRTEQGLIITNRGGGDYGAEGPYTSGKSTEVAFPLRKTGQTITSASGQPVAGTIHTHPGTGFLVPAPGAKVQTLTSGASNADRNLAKITKAPAFIIQPNDAIIRVDPNTQKSLRVLTQTDFTAYMKRAETARQAKQVMDALSMMRFR